MKKKFLIYAPPYDANSGGSIALHKLCDLLNGLNCEAFIYPAIPSFELNISNFNQLDKMIRDINSIVLLSRNYSLNPDLKTPVMISSFGDQASDDWVVIYPEITFGNPLNAKNVVRWMLYKPGFHTDKMYFTKNELHFYYNINFKNYKFPGAVDADLELRIEHYPFELYSKNFDNINREGTAYCLRKSGRVDVPFNAVHDYCIDGKSHQEISEIFGKVKSFISYDQWTAYSTLAAIAGCDSIIYPDCANEDKSRMGLDGVAYGFSDVERARKTVPNLVGFIRDKEVNNQKTISHFFDIVNKHFN